MLYLVRLCKYWSPQQQQQQQPQQQQQVPSPSIRDFHYNDTIKSVKQQHGKTIATTTTKIRQKIKQKMEFGGL